MSSDLERTLTRTLSAAADRAPDQPPDLLHRVEARYRQRHRRRNVAIAGIAVLVVAAGSVATVHNLTYEPPPPRPAPTVVAAPGAAPTVKPPIADVWPQAVHTISAKLGDGRGYYPIDLIDDHQLLVSTEASFEKADELWVVNLAEREARRVVRIPDPRPHTEGFASHFTVGSGHVVWWTSYVKDGKPYTDIWKAPLAGGEPALAATVPGNFGTTYFTGDRLAVANDAIYWSRASRNVGEHAVWRVPLAGGKPEKVPGTEGHYIISLPWVGKPGEAEETGCRPGQTFCEFDESTMQLYTELRNIDTGERRTADVSGMAGAVCGVTYCFELGLMGPRDSTLVRNRDGSNARVLPGWMGAAGPTGAMLPGLDRFVILAAGGQHFLYDLKTNQRADLGPVSGSNPPGTWLPENRLLFWSVDDGKAYVIVDLAAIP